MDASRLTLAFAILIGAYGLGRFVFGSASRAGDGMAALFVPPDRTLGWPRGVQERDDPWGWHAAPTAEPVTEDLDRPTTDVGAILEAPVARHTRYVAPPRRVAPIRFRSLH